MKTGISSLRPLPQKLLAVYSKLGSSGECITLLKEALFFDIVSWNIAIGACFSQGDLASARYLFDGMPIKNQATWTVMVDGFMKAGRVSDAVSFLRRSSFQSVVLWTAAISGLVHNGLPLQALLFLSDMLRAGVAPNEMTFTSTIRASIDAREFYFGKNLVGFIIKAGYAGFMSVCNSLITLHIKMEDLVSAKRIFDGMENRDVVTWTTTLDLYVKDGDLKSARKLFEEMPEKNEISWSAMVARYYQDGQVAEALKMFECMHKHGFLPTPSSLSPAICAAGAADHFPFGSTLHGFSIKLGTNHSSYVSSALISMYCSCKKPDEAYQIFDTEGTKKNLICWNAMIYGYCDNGRFSQALYLFEKMPDRKRISWNCMISGLVSGEAYLLAVEIFIEMVAVGEIPGAETFSSILCACAASPALDMGNSIHVWIIKIGLEDDLFVGTAMTDMYAKSGNIFSSKRVFSLMKEKNEASWSAAINGLAANGLADEALLLFNQVKKPTLNLFLVVLSACAQNGLVEEGICYFKLMKRHGLVPLEEHYSCLVDLFAKAGQLREAERIAESKGGVSAWAALLSCCRGRGEAAAAAAERAAARLREIEESDPRSYVLLSNVYAFVGRWGDVERVRALMGPANSRKRKGASWVGGRGRYFEFSCGIVLHERSPEINEILELLMLEISSNLGLGESYV